MQGAGVITGEAWHGIWEFFSRHAVQEEIREQRECEVADAPVVVMKFRPEKPGNSVEDNTGMMTSGGLVNRMSPCGILGHMTTMISELHDALVAAGAPEDKARRAAEAIANYDDRFNRIDVQLSELRGQNTLLRWMIGFNLAFTTVILWKVFS